MLDHIVRTHAQTVDGREQRDAAICAAIDAGTSAYAIAKQLRIELGEERALTAQAVRNIWRVRKKRSAA